MKRIVFFLFSVCLSFLVLSSCEKIDDKPTMHRLSFRFGTENSMYKTTKSAASDVFDEFYAKLSSGELVADSYNLTFTNVETGTAYSFSGNWKNAEVELQDATYRVTGKSTATGEKTQEKCSVYFDETVTVTKTSDIVLNALYDCFLFVMTSDKLANVDNCFLFNNKYWYAFVNGTFVSTLTGTHKDGSKFSVDMSGYMFDKGKYYIYDDVSLNKYSAFILLPKMDNGYPEWDGFRLKATSDNTVLVKEHNGSTYPNGKLYYSFDTQNWKEWEYGSEISLEKNQNLYLKGNMIFGETCRIAAKSGTAYGSGYVSSLFDNGTDYTTSAIPDKALQDIFYRDGGITGELKIPDVVKTIGTRNLYGYSCYGPWWTSVILPKELEFIGCTAFESNQMTEIIIPKTVKFIGDAAFCACYNLVKVSFTGTVAEWNAIEKGNYKWVEGEIPADKVICSDGEADF